VPRNPAISPPVGTGDSPALYKLPGLKFQALCRDMLDIEVGQCDEFGTNGQSQYGIDLIARQPPDRLDVAQCKGERDFPPAKIRAATQKFLEHWGYWRDKNVSRFILFVASELSQRQRQEEILKQRALLQRHGIAYEVWSTSTLVNRLRPHPGLVTTHLGAEWVKYICGSTEDSGLRLQLAGMSALTDRLSAALSDVTDSRVAQAKELWLSGSRPAAVEIIRTIRRDVVSWQTLTPTVQGSVLRLEASILMEADGPTAQIEDLLVQATNLRPDANDALLRAALVWRSGNVEQALAELAQAATERAKIQSAIYLAVLGRGADAATTLAEVTVETAERFRVEALVRLGAHRMAEARRAALKALELAPAHSLVRLSVAIVDYYSCLADAAVPTQVPAWPDPVPWKFIRRDDASQQRLRAAGERFSQLLIETDEKMPHRQCLEVWYMACLANDIERQDAAIAELEGRLHRDPENYRLLVWATAKFRRIDTVASFNVLRAAVVDRRVTSEQVIALAHYYVGRNQHSKALKLLDSERDVFAREHADNVWVAWKAQCAALFSGREAALEVLRDSTLTGTVRAALDAHIMRLAGGDANLPSTLRSLYAATTDAKYLLEALEILAEQGHWRAASEHCEEVLRAIGTAEVSWFVIDIAYRANRPDLCLRLLHDAQPFFPQARVPLELRRLRVHSQHRLGFVPTAIEEASRIVEEAPTAPNLLDFAQLLFTIGDQRRLCSVAERLLRHANGVAATDLLRLAWQCQWEDADLSRKLWRRAMKAGIPDEHVPPALLLGHSLGLEPSLRELTTRMMKLASEGKGNVQLATIEQLKQHSAAFHEHANRLFELYRNGQVPLHFIAAPLNQTLAHFFHEYRNDTADAPYAWTAAPLLTRHGRKGIPQTREDASSWTLKGDVSALLVAYHYRFLEQVESAFHPIRIAPQLVPELLLIQQKLAVPQLSRLTAAQELLSTLAAGQIREFQPSTSPGREDVPDSLQPDWLAGMRHAISNDGFFVDFFPIPTAADPIEPSTLPEDIQPHLIGPGAVLRSLCDHGPLSEEEYKTILDEQLRSLQAEAIAHVPAPGAVLFFRGTVLEVFASIGLLPRLVSKFRIIIESGEVRRLKDQLSEHERHTETARWVKSLIARVSDGIQSGTYEVLASVAERESTDDDHADTIDSKSLETLLRPAGLLNERLWIDDRCINGFERSDTVGIIDSVDLLQHLVSVGDLAPTDYFALIGRMRADGLCFIPLSPDEILSGIRSARVNNDAIVETTALSNLRRGVAFSLLQTCLLRNDAAFTTKPSRPSELGFLLQTMRSVEDALVALQPAAEKTDAGELRARRAWVVESLYASAAAVRRLAELPGHGVNGEYLEAVGHAGLLARAVALQGPDVERSGAREYMDWIFRRLIKPRIEQQPEYLPRISLTLSQLLEGSVPERTDDLPSRASAIVLQRFFEDLPQEIRSELLNSTELLSQIGIIPVSVVELGGMRLPSREFFVAASDVANGRSATVREIDAKEEIVFAPAGDNEEGFRFENVATGSVGSVNDPILRLLVDSVDERERIAAALMKDYDVPSAERASAVAEIVMTDDFATRIALAESQRDQDFQRFAADLETHIERRQPLRESDCWPKRPDSTCRYLRMSPEAEFTSASAEQSYGLLLADHPPEEAVARLAAIPIELPAAVEQRLMELPTSGRRQLVKYFLRRPRTPLATIQLARILIRCFGDDAAYRRLANLQLSRLLREGNVEIKAYLTLGRWVVGRMHFWRETNGWSETFRLVATWLIADCLFGVFMNAGLDPQWVVDRFTVTSVRAGHMFENRPEWQNDVAHPKNIEAEAFVVCGLAYAFESNSSALGQRLRHQVASTMLTESTPNFFPVMPLLVQPAAASNRLSSFLARDRITALYGALEPDSESALRAGLTNSPLQQAKAALETLGVQGWIVLAVVLGGFPPPDELVGNIAAAMKTTDFSANGDGNLRLGAMALSIASAFLVNFKMAEDTSVRLKEQLLLLVQGANRDPQSITEEVGATVLEVALNLSRANEMVADRVRDFSTSVAQLASECPSLGVVVRPIIQRICEDLPIELATELWRLNLRLRTARLP
jgi:tetratricopeptide (TPR) repeat protein